MVHALLRSAIVFLALLIAASPAAASVTCVQQGLATVGYDPGPIDGLLGQRTVETASNFGADHGVDLPRLSAGNADQWCAAVNRVVFGVAAVEIDPTNIEAGAPEGTSSPQCTIDPPDTYAREIRNMVDGDELSLRVSSRFGGAVESVVWRGKQFINIFDHGRQISYAWHLDGYGECFNPTEPGSARDLFDQTSTSQLLSVCSDGPTNLTTKTQPAFWLNPGDVGFCSGGATAAINQVALSNQLLTKQVTLGYRGIDNVIAFDAMITLEKDYQSLQVEIPTAYLTHEFTDRLTFNPQSGELLRPPSQPLNAPWSYNYSSPLPPILATADGEYAMGAYTAEPILGYDMLYYDVPNPSDSTNKWNMVIREQPAPAGDYHYLSFAIVGTLAEVQSAMVELYALHPTDFHPPEGYVDLANCTEIAGWAWDPKAPDQPVDIEIYRIAENGDRTLVHRATADHFREDLPPVLNDNGRHGYFIATDQVVSGPGPQTLVAEAVNSVEGLHNRPLQPNQINLICPAIASE